MRKVWIAAVALVAYSAILIRVVVFKAIPIIRIGHLRLRFGGPHTGQPNLVPFRTLAGYLNGRANHLIVMVNILGNIVPFAPVGFLAPFVFRRMTWRKALLFAIAVGLAMESMEALFRVGIFDVDDVMLNALGVMIGYWIFAMFAKRGRPEWRSS